MTTGKAGKAGGASKAALKAGTVLETPAAAPRLVGADGPAVEQPAEQSGGGNAADQSLTLGEKNKIGEAEPRPGEDNNRELAWLNGRYQAFVEKLGALGHWREFSETVDPDPFDAAIAALVAQASTIGEQETGGKDLAGKLETYRDRDARLLDTLEEAEGFVLAADESVHDAAIRVIGELRACVDGALKLAEERLETIAELDANPETGASVKDAAKAHAAAEKNEVATFAELPETGAITLRFGDGDRFIPTIPPIELTRDDFKPEGGRGLLMRAVDFDPGAPSARVTAAWIVAGRKTVKCEISGGINVGGGAMAKIPAGHLIF